MLDSHGRNINYLRISVTDRCNFRCKYCMPADGIEKLKHKDILRNHEIVDIVKAGIEIGIDKVRITGGEPMVRKGIVDLISEISSLPGIKDLAMTTNGYYLKEYGSALRQAGLRRLNISLDSFRDDRFKEITRGGSLLNVIEGIKHVSTLGFDEIKLNVVLLDGINDDEITSFIDFAYLYDIEVRFIELMPMGSLGEWSIDHVVRNNRVLDMFPNLIPISTSETSPSKTYLLPYGRGRIGLINPISQHFCGSCNRIRVTSNGKIKPCLHWDYEIDIKKELALGYSLEEVLIKAISKKPAKHNIDSEEYIPIIRDMYEIGG